MPGCTEQVFEGFLFCQAPASLGGLGWRSVPFFGEGKHLQFLAKLRTSPPKWEDWHVWTPSWSLPMAPLHKCDSRSQDQGKDPSFLRKTRVFTQPPAALAPSAGRPAYRVPLDCQRRQHAEEQCSECLFRWARAGFGCGRSGGLGFGLRGGGWLGLLGGFEAMHFFWEFVLKVLPT